MWYQCQECIFASNKLKNIEVHAAATGHTFDEEEE